MVTGMDVGIVQAARITLVLAMFILIALAIRAGVDRRRGDDEVCRKLPWWSMGMPAGYVLHAVLGQAARLEDDTLSWRFWLLSVSTAIGLAAMGTVLQWRPRARRRRRPPR